MMNIFEQLDSPSLLVFPEIVQRNIAEMVRMAGDVSRLRPHIKTHKTAEGIQMMMEAGIQKFKCATIAEAELLAMQNAPDVLLAHQPVGPKIQRLLTLTIKYPNTHFSCITDHEDAAASIADLFKDHNRSIDLYVDINVGMNRTGIAPDATSLLLIEHIHQTNGIEFKGLHVYDGQHRHADFEIREKACDQAFERVYELIGMMQKKGLPFPHIIAGGSPTFSIHAKKTDRDCSPGTNIFWDRGYATICAEQHFEPAVHILTRVISLPTATRICLDLGHKAVASENEITKRVYFPEHPTLLPVGQSEEHLVMEAGEGHGFKPGDILFGIPYHVCPTIALHESLYAIEDNQLTGEWKVLARKRIMNV
jgi:D-serine deaminase-like pyridoxal phosphate-dependent protein